MNTQFMFMGGFMITAGMISYWDIHDCHELPWPPRIVATGLVFAMLDLFSAFSPELAAIVAIGFMLAMIVNGKIHAACKITKPRCGAQASDLVGLPPPKLNEPTPTGPFFPNRPGLPSGTPELPPGGGIPELPAFIE